MLAWQNHLTNFATMTSDPHASGRVCSHPLVRGDRFMVIQPEGTTTSSNWLSPAIVTTHEVATGKEISRYVSPITRSTFQTSNSGSQDTDLVCGVFWGETIDNTIIAATGGDFPGRWTFDADNGTGKITALGATTLGSGSNCATAFTSHPRVPFVVSGGNNNHSNMSLNGAIHRLAFANSAPWVGYKQWNVGLIHEGTQAVYRLDDTARTASGVYGMRVWGSAVAHGGVGCDVVGWTPYNAIGNDGFGYPKPATMLASGAVAVLCCRAQKPWMGTTRTLPSYSETRVVYVLPKPNGKTGMIAGFTSWKALDFVTSDAIPYTDSGLGIPQLIPCDNEVIAFFPPREQVGGFVAKVDAMGRVAWINNVPVLKRFTEPYRRDNFPRHASISAVVQGNELLILECELSQLFVRRYSLVTGNFERLSTVALGFPLQPLADYVAIQSVQRTAAGTLVSILYRSLGKTHQSVIMLSDTTPEPIPEPPVVTAAEKEVLDFAWPRLSAEKYSAIEKVIKGI